MCNMVPYDNKHEEIVLNGGSNEILRTSSREEFVFTVEKTEEKLRKLAEDRKVIVVVPKPPTFGPEEDGKQQYYAKKLKAIESITTIDLKDVEFDETSHPTERGTTVIIDQIAKAIGGEIILEVAGGDVTAKRKYSQVNVTYKVGCRGCDTPNFTPSLCPNCNETAKAVNVQELDVIIEAIREEMYPELFLNSPTSVTIPPNTKRERDSDSSDEEANKTKNHKNDADPN